MAIWSLYWNEPCGIFRMVETERTWWYWPNQDLLDREQLFLVHWGVCRPGCSRNYWTHWSRWLIPTGKETVQVRQTPGPWFSIKMSYQYRKSHCGEKTVVRSSYLHNGISYIGKMAYFYWISPLIPYELSFRRDISMYLHFISFLHTQMLKVVEIFSNETQGLPCPI